MSTPTVILIEDDPLVIQALRGPLEMVIGPHRMLCVATSLYHASIHFADNTDPVDLVICDGNLPDGHGLDFCKNQRASGAAFPIILHSGTITEEHHARARALDVFCVNKGNVRTLLTAIEGILAG